jgi:uncharacterized protein YbjT (DUF2867 family)
VNTILVTGAAGNTGSLIVQHLLSQGEHVRAFVRSGDAGKVAPHPNLEIAIGDLDDVASVRSAMKGAAVAYLLAANSPSQVVQEIGVIDAARAEGVRRLVKHSAAGADAAHANPILQWHGQAEAALKRSGLSYTILRPHWFFQNLFWFAQPGHETVTMALGHEKVAAIDIRDIAEVAARVLTTPGHEGKTYTLTGPQALSAEEMAAQLAGAIGERKRYVAVDEAAFAQSLQANGQPAWMAQALAQLFAQVVGAGAQAGVNDDAARLLGRPARNLGQFFQDFADVFRK